MDVQGWNNGGGVSTSRITNFMYRVFAFMAGALLLTSVTAYYVSQSPAFVNALFRNPFLLIGLFIAQLGLVFAINYLVLRLSFPALLALFGLYALSLGLTASSIFLVYQLGSIYVTFLVTAALFAAMAIYGYYTKTDLTAMGNLLGFALIGIIIALLVNLFLRSPMLDTVVSGIGVLVFIGLIAFDAQKIKRLGAQMLGAESKENNVALVGALILYLDVINLFLFLLRFLGKRKE